VRPLRETFALGFRVRYKGGAGVLSEGLPQRRELKYAASMFPSVEINGTFYSLQRPEVLRRGLRPRLTICVCSEGPRFITHMKKLNDCETPLANFFASGIFQLGHKLGPILWQLPPNLGLTPSASRLFQAVASRHESGRAIGEWS